MINPSKRTIKTFCIITEGNFYELAHSYLDNVFNKLDSNEKIPFDNIDYSQGVLNFTLNKNRHYVLNIQRPNRQIWLSSPLSGPQRYEYEQINNRWLNIRNKVDLNLLLSDEINKLLLESRLLKEKLSDILYMKSNIININKILESCFNPNYLLLLIVLFKFLSDSLSCK